VPIGRGRSVIVSPEKAKFGFFAPYLTDKRNERMNEGIIIVSTTHIPYLDVDFDTWI
jgi:hypothetical protein